MREASSELWMHFQLDDNMALKDEGQRYLNQKIASEMAIDIVNAHIIRNPVEWLRYKRRQHHIHKREDKARAGKYIVKRGSNRTPMAIDNENDYLLDSNIDVEQIMNERYPNLPRKIGLWKAAKEERVRSLVEHYGDALPQQVREALLAWEYDPE